MSRWQGNGSMGIGYCQHGVLFEDNVGAETDGVICCWIALSAVKSSARSFCPCKTESKVWNDILFSSFGSSKLIISPNCLEESRTSKFSIPLAKRSFFFICKLQTWEGYICLITVPDKLSSTNFSSSICVEAVKQFCCSFLINSNLWDGGGG